MKIFTTSCLVLLSSVVAASPAEKRASGPKGFDISHYQGTVDFAGAYSSGARFVLIKATEGLSYKDSGFSSHYSGATKAKLIRGGYHFARPDQGDPAGQAAYFVKNGGGWSKDGITLPGMLDIEYASSGDSCYSLSKAAMVTWISSWVSAYHSKTGRYPIIYTTADWWKTCTGDSAKFSSTCPLMLARHGSSVGTIPGGWKVQTIWQFDDSYKYGGDSDVFNGSEDGLKKLASG